MIKEPSVLLELPGLDSQESRSQVPAIGRAATVLSALSQADRTMTFAELCASVPLPRSSLHNVLGALAEAGYVERSPDGRFGIGWAIVDLARNKLNGMSLVREFNDVTEKMGRTPETMVLAVLRGADATYVAVNPGSQRVVIQYEIGMKMPAAFTASGMAILSTLSADRVRQLMGASITSSVAAAANKSIDTLLIQLHRARAKGYAVDDEETARGMICVGVPVVGRHTREALGAVAISAVKSACSLEDIIGRARSVAQMVSERLGKVDAAATA